MTILLFLIMLLIPFILVWNHDLHGLYMYLSGACGVVLLLILAAIESKRD